MADLILEPVTELGGAFASVQQVVDGQASAQRVLRFPSVDLEAFDLVVYEQNEAGDWSVVASTVGVAEGSAVPGTTTPGPTPTPTGDAYTKQEADALLAAKADLATTYSKTDVDTLLAAKQSVAAAILLPTTTTRTADYTLALADAGCLVPVASASAVTVTVPPNASVAFPTGTTLYISQDGTGDVTIAGANGVAVQTADGYKIGGRWLEVALHKRDLNTWVLKGGVS